MRRFAFVLIALSLASCGFDQSVPEEAQVESPAPETAKPTEEVAEAPPPEEAETDSLAEAANALVRQGNGHFRFDRVREVKGGATKRQLFVEMVGPSEAEAGQTTADVLTSLGFTERRRRQDDGGIRMAFADPDGLTVQVLVRSRAAHSKLERDDATSSVYLTQTIEQ
jgi:hypothetical protein